MLKGLTERQLEIIESAVDMIHKIGVNKITFKKIAQKLGVTEPAIYRHFRNKKEFVKSLYLYMQDRFSENADKIINRKIKAETKIKRIIKFILGFNVKNQGLSFILMSHAIISNDEQLIKLMNNIKNSFKEKIKIVLFQAKKQKYINKNIDLDISANLLIAITQSQVINYLLSNKKIKPNDKLNHILKYYMKMLK
jgi:TetR/AcrR family transcriptional regulator